MEQTRYRSLWPLPGGAGCYVETLRELLDIAADEPTREEFVRAVGKLGAVRSRRPSRGYLSVISNLGLVKRVSGRVVLTGSGERLRRTGDLKVLRDALQDRIVGVTEILTALEAHEDSFEGLQAALERHGIAWKGPMQVRYRIWWMLAAGLIDAVETGPNNVRRFRRTRAGRR